MNYITLTAAMKDRMIKNITENVGTNKKRNEKKNLFELHFKKIISLAACLLLIISGIWFYVDHNASSQITSSLPQYTPPFVEVNTLQELENNIGFDMEELDFPFTITDEIYIAYGNMGEIQYIPSDSSRISYRKSFGDEDNSGDYNIYTNEETIVINGLDFTLKAFGDQYQLVNWSSDGYSYSLRFDEPVTKSELEDILSSV